MNWAGSIEFFHMMESPISISAPRYYPIYLIVTGLIFILALSVGKRGFCHTTCWMAPFLIFGTRLQRIMRFPSLQLHANTEKCVECGRCTKECPMSLDVKSMVTLGEMGDAECVLCGNCADTCNKGVINFTFRRAER
jgi:polyferredoxin